MNAVADVDGRVPDIGVAVAVGAEDGRVGGANRDVMNLAAALATDEDDPLHLSSQAGPRRVVIRAPASFSGGLRCLR